MASIRAASGAQLSGQLSPECGPGTEVACGTAILVTVTVTARPGWPIVVDLSLLRRNYRIHSLSDLMGVDYYEGPDCTNAAEMYAALSEQLQILEEEANQVELATANVAHQTCEAEHTEGGFNDCIDLFIMSARAAFILEGDDRRFDPYSPFKASRAQLYINPQLCIVARHVSPTRTLGFGPFDGGVHEPHTLNKVTATVVNGTCVVEWKLLNGYCEGRVPNVFCAAIDGKITYRRDSNGRWFANIEEDRYPSRGYYRWTGNGWQTISERTETIWLDLMSRRRHMETIRLTRSQVMPRNCDLS